MLIQASQWSQSSHFTISVGNNLAVPGPGTSTQQPSRRWAVAHIHACLCGTQFPELRSWSLRTTLMLRNVSLFSVRGRV